MLYWLYSRECFSFFNGNGYQLPYDPFRTFAAAGALKIMTPTTPDPFTELKEMYEREKDWLIGRLNYDLKNNLEALASNNPDRLNAQDMVFFVPETLIFIDPEGIMIASIFDPVQIFEEILDFPVPPLQHRKLQFECDTTKTDYVHTVDSIKTHILDGDFYELNYCMEFFTRVKDPDLAGIYLRLNKISPMPFSVFQGIVGQYIVSGSPERFLKKQGDTLMAQPIKGTIRRDEDPRVDDQLKRYLRESEKEMAENMMIVDLMRNDLGKSACTGTVQVPEMFGIYSYNHLHQMISTITAQLSDKVHFVDAIKHAFPMGSMTGAPKIRVMERIEFFEKSKRGMFSGAAGYITPEGDFDFNVLIRSIFYSASTEFMKFNAGSAITYDAEPEDEYKECLLKTNSMRLALSGNN